MILCHVKSYIAILGCYFEVAQALCDFKTCTILVYLILNATWQTLDKAEVICTCYGDISNHSKRNLEIEV